MYKSIILFLIICIHWILANLIQAVSENCLIWQDFQLDNWYFLCVTGLNLEFGLSNHIWCSFFTKKMHANDKAEWSLQHDTCPIEQYSDAAKGSVWAFSWIIKIQIYGLAISICPSVSLSLNTLKNWLKFFSNCCNSWLNGHNFMKL